MVNVKRVGLELLFILNVCIGRLRFLIRRQIRTVLLIWRGGSITNQEKVHWKDSFPLFWFILLHEFIHDYCTSPEKPGEKMAVLYNKSAIFLPPKKLVSRAFFTSTKTQLSVFKFNSSKKKKNEWQFWAKKNWSLNKIFYF